MSSFKRVLAGLVLALIAAAGWAQQPAAATVPLSGQYYESGAGGWVQYAGIVTIVWIAPSDGSSGRLARVSVVAHAYCLDTGEGYAFYGIGTESAGVSDGDLPDLEQPFVAVGADDRPAFQGMLVVKLDRRSTAEAPAVAAVVIASR